MDLFTHKDFFKRSFFLWPIIHFSESSPWQQLKSPQVLCNPLNTMVQCPFSAVVNSLERLGLNGLFQRENPEQLPDATHLTLLPLVNKVLISKLCPLKCEWKEICARKWKTFCSVVRVYRLWIENVETCLGNIFSASVWTLDVSCGFSNIAPGFAEAVSVVSWYLRVIPHIFWSMRLLADLCSWQASAFLMLLQCWCTQACDFPFSTDFKGLGYFVALFIVQTCVQVDSRCQ